MGRPAAAATASTRRHLATGSNDKTVCVWDVAGGVEVARFAGHPSMVTAIAWSPCGKRLVSGSRAKTNNVRVWDVEAAEAKTGNAKAKAKGKGKAKGGASEAANSFELIGPKHRVSSVAWSADGMLIAAGAYRLVWIWDARTGALIKQLKGHSNHVSGVAWAPGGGGVLATVSEDHLVKVWDVRAGKELLSFKPPGM